MKIECIKEKLGEAVGRAEKIAGRNPTLPVLSGLYLKATQNSLSIKATNLDLGISINIPIKTIEPGEVVVPAQTLNSLLNSLAQSKSVNLITEKQILKVKTENTETSIKTLTVEEFPIIPEISDDEAFSLPSRDLVVGLKSVIYAASVGSMKPELSSVNLFYEGDTLVFVATDSFRLAEKRIRVKKIPHFKQILIPQKNVSEIIRIFDSIDDDVSISIGENQVAFRGGGVYLVSRVIDGTFPDYKQIIPKETTSKAVVLKQDLINSLKTSLIFSDNLNQIHLEINPSKKIFEVESKNMNVGESVYAVPAVVEGDALSINVNHRYLTDCFTSIPVDSVSISFAGQAKPIIITGIGDKTFMYLTMPMNKS